MPETASVCTRQPASDCATAETTPIIMPKTTNNCRQRQPEGRHEAPATSVETRLGARDCRSAEHTGGERELPQGSRPQVLAQTVCIGAAASLAGWPAEMPNMNTSTPTIPKQLAGADDFLGIGLPEASVSRPRRPRRRPWQVSP
jgi:hypothetical protein